MLFEALHPCQSTIRDLKALYDQLMDVDSLLNDFNQEISGYADELDVDEETLEKTEERLDLINHLKTKYGDTIEKIQAYCEEKAAFCST